MKKDARKRNTIKEYGVYKLRYNTIRKNDIIPLEIQVNITKSNPRQLSNLNLYINRKLLIKKFIIVQGMLV